jgi:hypothetical protein
MAGLILAAYGEKLILEITKNEATRERAARAPPMMATMPAATTEADARIGEAMCMLITAKGTNEKERAALKSLDISL